jgi:uncharacterized protein
MPSPTDIRPPFDEATARAKVQAAEDTWNTRDPDRVALAYTEDSEWRNRDEFLQGRDEIRAFLRRKWSRATPRASGGAPTATRCGSSTRPG